MANVSDELQQLRKRARRRLVGAITLVVFALTFLWTVLDGEPPKNLVDNHSVEIISSAPALSSIVASATSASAMPAVPQAVISAPPIEASKVAPVALPGKLVSHQAEKMPIAVKPKQEQAEVVESQEVAKPSPAKIEAAKPEVIKPSPTKKPVEKVVAKTPEPKKIVANNPAAILEGKHPTTVAATDKKTYFIQVGAYADAEKAAQLVAKLKNAGVRVSSEKISSSKGELTRVRVGPTEDEAKAKAWIKVMQDIGVSGTLIAKAAP